MISEKFDGQVMLDKLSKDLANSIDKQVLYEAMGWTIVTADWSCYTGEIGNMIEWLETQCGEFQCWDGQIAFKEGKDATMFILRWL